MLFRSDVCPILRVGSYPVLAAVCNVNVLHVPAAGAQPKRAAMSDSKFGAPLGGRARSNNNADDDDEFNDGLEDGRPPAGIAGGLAGRPTAAGGTVLHNQPFDEAVDVEGDEFDESVDTHALGASHASPGARGGGGRRGGGGASGLDGMDSPPDDRGGGELHGEYASDTDMSPAHVVGSTSSASSRGGGVNPRMVAAATGVDDGASSMDARPLSATDTPSPGLPPTASVAPGVLGIPPKRAAYNPADFAALQVTDDVRELFEYIGRYKPATVELETKLKCFIPEYIPAIGDVDPFIKPPRPDGKEETLGLTVLDEPSPHQSDPTVLDMQLRAMSKKAGVEPLLVRSIEGADKNPKEITKWITSIADLHKTKPPPQVHYAKPMPDSEKLMQEWPPAFEALLHEVQLPGADTDLSTEEYARIVCALLDVPVYGSLVQSLHLVFTLYNDFKANQHFAQYDDAGAAPPPS